MTESGEISPVTVDVNDGPIDRHIWQNDNDGVFNGTTDEYF